MEEEWVAVKRGLERGAQASARYINVVSAFRAQSGQRQGGGQGSRCR